MKKEGLLFIVCLLVLTGCWDRREINDVAFVVGSAIDKKEDMYLSTLQIPLASQLGGTGSSGGGGGTGGGKNYFLDSTSGSTVREANGQLQKSFSRQLYFSHRRVLVVGEELAKDGLKPVLDVLGRVPQNRLTAFLVVARGEGRDLLNVDAPLEQYPAEMIREISVNAMKTPRTMKDLVNLIIDSGVDPILPALQVRTTKPGNKKDQKKTIELAGLAAFREDKLAGFVPPDLATGVLIAIGQAKRVELAVDSPKGNGKVFLAFPDTESKVIPHLKNGIPSITIEVSGKGSILENTSNFLVSREDNMNLIEKTASQALKQQIKNGMKLLQKDFGCDGTGTGLSFHKEYPYYWERAEKDWPQIYPTLPVHVSVNLQLETPNNLIAPLGREREEIIE